MNLDKARRLLWLIKQKYGRKILPTLMILAGNALELTWALHIGRGGRADVWEPGRGIYWDPRARKLADERYSGDVTSRILWARKTWPDLCESGRAEWKAGSAAAARDIRER